MKELKTKEDLFLENGYFLEIDGARVVLTPGLAEELEELYEKCKEYQASGFWPEEGKKAIKKGK